MPLPYKIVDLIPKLNLIPHPEGGFFVETYRSGSIPMSTQGQTCIEGCHNPDHNLIPTKGRETNRPDGDVRRNALTSIFWVPTITSPEMVLTINCSDHVHYYQGGRPFKYVLYDPEGCDLTEVVLGPDVDKGHKLQVCVRGGLWKCGHLIPDSDVESNGEDSYEYSLIGEAVAPGK